MLTRGIFIFDNISNPLQLPTIEPLPDLEKRCYKSLDHICESFHITKYLDTKKHEMEEKQRKAQEQHERDNPKMGKKIFYTLILTEKSKFQCKVCLFFYFV